MVNGIAFCSAAQLLLDGDFAADPRAVGAREAVDAGHLHGLRPDLRHTRTPLLSLSHSNNVHNAETFT